MSDSNMRFGFGRNWHRFVRRNFTAERLRVAKDAMLSFLGRADLSGVSMLDIGCGSGLHAYAAIQAGAARVHCIDYDPNAVRAAKELRQRANAAANWTIEQGDVLDTDFLARLGRFDLVYSWGVLHHTGAMWQAIRNAQALVAPGGLFFIALYSRDVQTNPQFWLDRKRDYNRGATLKRAWMVLWYVWVYGMGSSLRGLPGVVKQIVSYRFNRGMNYFTDVRDWLGGWPMEFAPDQDVVDLLEGECGFRLVNCSTGQACTQFLFRHVGTPPERNSQVTEFVARQRAAASA